jgi:hypothetical protein
MNQPKIKVLTYKNDLQDNSQRVVREAVYARYSSIGNSHCSADEQILRIRSYVERGLIQSKMFPGALIAKLLRVELIFKVSVLCS